MNNWKYPILGTAILIGLCWANIRCSPQPPERKPSPAHDSRVVGYVAGYRDFDFSTIDAAKLTHINYAFANIIDGRVQFDDGSIDGTALDEEDIRSLLKLKTINPNLKVLVSVGGWTWSGNFSDAALSEGSRTVFAESAAEFVKRNGLDGIDLDWEYPNQVGAGNMHRPEDKGNFTLLLGAVREHLDKLAAAENRKVPYLLTIATGADEAYITNTELGSAQKHLDFLNIMTYDFYNGLHKVTGHHSNLYPSMNPSRDKNSVIHAVDLHLETGVPPEKITIGIPFYGRKWEGVRDSGAPGIYQEAGTVGMIESYHVIAARGIDKDGFTRYWDEKALVPFLWNPESGVFISYEDKESIAHKIEYMKSRDLSGVMFWEYSDDDSSTLLKAIHNNLIR
jgi:chitinase